MSMKKAYSKAKKYIRMHWKFEGQIHLGSILESDQNYIFSFFPFISGKSSPRLSGSEVIEVHGIMGYVPVYYGPVMPYVQVEKNSETVTGLWFYFHDYIEGRVDEYFADYFEIDPRRAFEERPCLGECYCIVKG